MILEARNVTIGYSDHEVITRLTLGFEAGKIHSILGPNGCGKSTLLKSIGKQIQTTNGEIVFKNSEINQWGRKDFAKELAFLMQVHESNPEITVKQLIEYGRFPHKRTFERLNEEDLEIVNLAIMLTNLEELS